MVGPMTCAQHEHDLTALLGKSEPGRLHRAASCRLDWVNWDGFKWTARALGAMGQIHTPSIRLSADCSVREFACTCPDHKNPLRGSYKGPCKHVIALAKEALDELTFEAYMSGDYME